MKKIATIATLALFAVAFTSCKKDYTCTCKVTVNGQVVTEVTNDLGKQTKKDAEAACEDYKASTTGPSGTTGTTECTLN